MRIYRVILLVIPFLLLSACGGGSSDPYDDYYYEPDYIYWSGSANGTLVIDATDDAFEFEAYTGYLHFGNTTYTNAWVDDFGYFYIDGFIVGAVYYVWSIDDEVITALISNNGYYIDIYGPESDLAWTEAPTQPVYAFNSLTAVKPLDDTTITQSAQLTDAKPSPKATPPEMKMNALTEDLPKNNQSTLGSKE